MNNKKFPDQVFQELISKHGFQWAEVVYTQDARIAGALPLENMTTRRALRFWGNAMNENAHKFTERQMIARWKRFSYDIAGDIAIISRYDYAANTSRPWATVRRNEYTRSYE